MLPILYTNTNFRFLTWLCMLVWVVCQDDLIPDTYKKHIRPIPEGGGPVRIGVGWHISRIHQVNVNGMFLEISIRPTISWQDPRIQYDGEHHEEEHGHLLPLNMDYLLHTWKPDLFFLDTREITRFTMIDEVAGLWLMPNRTFFLSFLTKIKLDCPMHFRSYPFDSQTCWMTMVSYEYNKEEILLHWMHHGLTFSHVMEDQLPGYHVTFGSANITDHPWCEDCFLEPSSALTAAINLKRRYGAFLLTMYIPSSLFVAIGWASFFWPPEPIPGRTVLVITSLLTVVSMFSSIRQSSPYTDYPKATDVWFFTCICFNVAVLFEFAVIVWGRRQQQKLSKSSIAPVSPVAAIPSEQKTPSNGSVLVRTQNTLQLAKLQEREEKLEMISKLILPFFFLLFNLIYWPVYLI